MTEELKQRLLDEAKEYERGELELFLAELGWEDWMNEYTDAEEDEPISEEEGKIIDKILIDIFIEAHEGECEDEEQEEECEYDIEELENALEEFYGSCIRTEHYDMLENAKYFCRENNHLELDVEEIYAMLQEIQQIDS